MHAVCGSPASAGPEAPPTSRCGHGSQWEQEAVMSEEREEFPESRPSLFDDAELLEAVQDVFGADALKLLQEDETAGNDSEGTSVAAALQEAWDAEAERRRCETPAVGERQVVVLIGPYRIGIPLAQVLEVQPRPPVTSLPGVADWIRGVWNRRGEVTALSDLRRLFGLSGVAASRPQRVVVVRDTSGTRVTSLLVDGVLGMRPVAAR
ncbi:MAG: chemotaxis protein CheW, partial [Planctomycetota bacterium]